MKVDDTVFILIEEDVQGVAQDYLGRALTEDEMSSFVHKFDIHNWYEHVLCHIQALGFEGNHV